MRPRSGRARMVALVVAAQALLVVSYLVVERQRSAEEPPPGDSRLAAPTMMDAPLPALHLRRRDGRRVSASAPGRLTVLHFWGTWCPPCRAELPGLLSLPSRHPVEVVAVALDRDWDSVAAFFGGRVDERVVLGDADAVRDTLGVRTLPVTFLVSAEGRVMARFEGERRWEDPAFCERWLRAAPTLDEP